MLNQRIFVTKKAGFQIKAEALKTAMIKALDLKTLASLQIIQIYDVFNVEQAVLDKALHHVFAEAVTDEVLVDIDGLVAKGRTLAIEALPGQFDQRAASAKDALILLGSSRDVEVTASQVYIFNQDLSDSELGTIQNYLLNPVDSRIKDLTSPLELTPYAEVDGLTPELVGFREMTESELAQLHREMGFAFELADLVHIQAYFRQIKRNPTETEIKVLDTYWSDHTRHTTFETELVDIDLSASSFQKQLQASFDKYLQMKHALNRQDKPVTLMDLATVFGRYERQSGRLDDMEVSDEINACSVYIDVDVDGVKEPWLLMFKNETHNHPTEIEPFGGASTCIGGAIRDPLSGRSYVYQAMRITGAGDITADFKRTLPGKLPQQLISKGAAHGYSSYGNQIGLATSYVREYFHPGFVAKRLETGAVVGAVPANQVVRKQPQAGDVIILLGGATGRDGVGGATGSSKVHTKQSLETSGAEVQKGNAIEERKIQRLFRDPEVTTLIKKSNDFGAGGVCVAIGELADGVKIDLDAVPLKYQGLTGTEIAISESQERMAVVVDKADQATFISHCSRENIHAVVVATVTAKPSLVMTWQNKTIVDIDRAFLDTNGVRNQVAVKVADRLVPRPYQEAPDLVDLLSQHNHASQKGLQTLFDSSIGRGTVNSPLGGKYQMTPAESSAHKIPVLKGTTQTVSVLAHGYNPEISDWSPYHGASYAMIEAVARLVATGSDWQKARFSYQEYFERMDKQPEKFGLPFAALLGSIEAQSQLGLPAIGGKDSMSGSFEDLHVPPTLIAFGVTTSSIERITSPEFKASGEYLYYLPGIAVSDEIDWDRVRHNFELMSHLRATQAITAVTSIRSGGAQEAIATAMFGNQIGVELDAPLTTQAEYAGFIFTSPQLLPGLEPVGRTIADFRLNGRSGTDLLAAYEAPLASVYPTEFGTSSSPVVALPEVSMSSQVTPSVRVETPTVYIPVFPGTNCEYDTLRAFEAAGARTEVVPFRTLDAMSIQASIEEMVAHINSAHILMFAGGFSAADEPDGSAKFIVNILQNPDVQAAIKAFLAKGHLILGICNGFQALVKSGLLPEGDFVVDEQTSPTLFYNDANQHVAKMVQTKITSVNSPWLRYVSLGDQHTIPVSHGEGKFVVPQATLDKLIANGQIFSQYCDFEGQPSMDSRFNPNGAVAAIEGIISANGQILGKMGHSERYESGLFKNNPGQKDQKLFESAVAYFRGE